MPVGDPADEVDELRGAAKRRVGRRCRLRRRVDRHDRHPASGRRNRGPRAPSTRDDGGHVRRRRGPPGGDAFPAPGGGGSVHGRDRDLRGRHAGARAADGARGPRRRAELGLHHRRVRGRRRGRRPGHDALPPGPPAGRRHAVHPGLFSAAVRARGAAAGSPGCRRGRGGGRKPGGVHRLLGDDAAAGDTAGEAVPRRVLRRARRRRPHPGRDRRCGPGRRRLRPDRRPGRSRRPRGRPARARSADTRGEAYPPQRPAPAQGRPWFTARRSLATPAAATVAGAARARLLTRRSQSRPNTGSTSGTKP